MQRKQILADREESVFAEIRVPALKQGEHD